MQQDIFGLDRERKIVKSNVRKIFTPHQPIQSLELFFGRQKEVQKIVEQINTPGQHSLLYGDRGVGKSSLANIATQLLIRKLIKGELYSKRCDSNDTFNTIVEQPLRDCGYELNLDQTKHSHTQGGGAGIDIKIANAKVKRKEKITQTFHNTRLSPSMVAEKLLKVKGLLYIDELDRLSRKKDKQSLAELIKLLSDNGSPFKILIVGIANTADELTGAHPSVQRCLKETKLRRMPSNELSLIVTHGAKELRLKFEDDVIKSIVRLSSGYPHFTHLLALKCAEEAIANDEKIIRSPDLIKALRLSVEDAEGTIKRKYDNATRSYSTDIYKTILLAATKINRDEFSAQELREKIEKITGKTITQASLNNFLRRLVSSKDDTIFVRVAKGMYKFSDPRMPNYIKILNCELN